MKVTLKFVPNETYDPPEHKLPEGFEDFNDGTCVPFEELEQTTLKTFETVAYKLSADGEKVAVEGNTVCEILPSPFPAEKKPTKSEQKIADAVAAFDADGEVVETVMTWVTDASGAAAVHVINSEADLPKVEPIYEEPDGLER